MKPVFSVVTMTYKKIDLLYKTIDSVMNQDYPNIEYIISDDGTPGFPSEEINDYIQSRRSERICNVQILTSEQNYGTVKNINKAYKAATGKYIVPLSCNDIFFDAYVLSNIANYFEKHENEILVTSRVACDRDGLQTDYIPKKKCIKRINRLNTPLLQHKAFLRNEFYDMASGSVLVLKKDFIEKWGYFDESYFLWEDGPFFTKYTEHHIIPHEYNIISIKYDTSGVSNSGTNPLMLKDYVYFNRYERGKDIKKYDYLTRRKIQYIQERDTVNNKMSCMRLYLKYLDVMLWKIIYKIQNN